MAAKAVPFRASGPIVRDGVLGAALNAELRALVLQLSQTSPGQTSNMASGRSYFSHKWLSPKDLHQLASHRRGGRAA